MCRLLAALLFCQKGTPMDNFITVELHEEFAKRMEDEHKRQNHRIATLEKALEENNKLLVSVEKLALSMENMQKELRSQGDRLEIVESRDGEKWRKVVSHVITVAIGIIVGFLFKQIGM